MRYRKVQHPEWVEHCNIDRTVQLSKARKIPESIEGFMLVTACKHLLRCVYGTDLRAAFSLLGEALWEQISRPWRYVDWLLHRKRWEAEVLADEMREIENEIRESTE